jgi:DNA repair exonuclease SbcCD ATPase subunit
MSKKNSFPPSPQVTMPTSQCRSPKPFNDVDLESKFNEILNERQSNSSVNGIYSVISADSYPTYLENLGVDVEGMEMSTVLETESFFGETTEANVAFTNMKEGLSEAEQTIKDLKRRLLRRAQITEEIRKAYLRDIISLKRVMHDVLDKSEREEILKIHDSHIPSLDMKEMLDLYGPKQSQMIVRPCETCGGHLEIVLNDAEKVVKLMKSIEHLKGREDKLRITIAGQDVRIDNINAEKNEAFKLHGDEKRFLYGEVTRLKEELEQSDDEVIRSTKENKKMRDQVNEYKSSNNSLKVVAARALTLEKETAEQALLIDSIQEQLRKEGTKISNLRDELKTLKSESAELKTDRDRLQSELTVSRVDAANSKVAHEKIQKMYDELQLVIIEANKKTAFVEQQVIDLNDEMREFLLEKEELDVENKKIIDGLNGEIDVLKKTLNDRDEEITKKNADIIEYMNKVASDGKILDGKDNAIIQLGSDIESLEEQLKAMKQLLADAALENSSRMTTAKSRQRDDDYDDGDYDNYDEGDYDEDDNDMSDLFADGSVKASRSKSNRDLILPGTPNDIPSPSRGRKRHDRLQKATNRKVTENIYEGKRTEYNEENSEEEFESTEENTDNSEDTEVDDVEGQECEEEEDCEKQEVEQLESQKKSQQDRVNAIVKSKKNTNTDAPPPVEVVSNKELPKAVEEKLNDTKDTNVNPEETIPKEIVAVPNSNLSLSSNTESNLPAFTGMVHEAFDDEPVVKKPKKVVKGLLKKAAGSIAKISSKKRVAPKADEIELLPPPADATQEELLLRGSLHATLTASVGKNLANKAINHAALVVSNYGSSLNHALRLCWECLLFTKQNLDYGVQILSICKLIKTQIDPSITNFEIKEILNDIMPMINNKPSANFTAYWQEECEISNSLKYSFSPKENPEDGSTEMNPYSVHFGEDDETQRIQLANTDIAVEKMKNFKSQTNDEISKFLVDIVQDWSAARYIAGDLEDTLEATRKVVKDRMTLQLNALKADMKKMNAELDTAKETILQYERKEIVTNAELDLFVELKSDYASLEKKFTKTTADKKKLTQTVKENGILIKSTSEKLEETETSLKILTELQEKTADLLAVELKNTERLGYYFFILLYNFLLIILLFIYRIGT